MAYRRGQAPGGLDTDGVRKFTDQELLRVQRATADMDKTVAEIQSDITGVQTDITNLQNADTALDARLDILEASKLASNDWKFVIGSATTCFLTSFNGNKIKINGQYWTIPNVGVQITNSGLAANTVYYCYATISGGNIALSWSNTGHVRSASSGNEGVEILSGNDLYSLVGMVRTNAASQFENTETARHVRSWKNDNGIRSHRSLATTFNLATPSVWVEDTNMRISLLLWNAEKIFVSGLALAYHSATGAAFYVGVYVNGSTVLGMYSANSAPGVGYWTSIPISHSWDMLGDTQLIVGMAMHTSSATMTTINRALNVLTSRDSG